MAKRRKRNNSPDLPEATLARARKQARGESVDSEPEDETSVEEAKSTGSTKVTTSSRRSRRRAAPQPTQIGQQPNRKSDGAMMSSAAISERLANPTIFVSEEQLQEEYGFVVSDIRNMFILTGILIVVLVALAQFI